MSRCVCVCVCVCACVCVCVCVRVCKRCVRVTERGVLIRSRRGVRVRCEGV